MQVLDIKPWVMHAEVAEKYLTCNNRVILVGDAAHRFPPAGGFGKKIPLLELNFVAELLNVRNRTLCFEAYRTEN